MRINKIYFLVGLFIAFFMFMEISAHAGERDERTMITFSAPVQIPGQVLPAGTYLFEQAVPDTDQDIIRIYNADRSLLYTTLQTIPAQRVDTNEKTTITLAEPESGNPVLVKWFYPGSLTGHEFIYSKEQEQTIAQAPQETFVGGHMTSSSEFAGE